MKLKAQPPLPKRATKPARRSRSRSGAVGRGRGARRPGVPFRQRFAGRLPSIRRLLAGLGAVASAAVIVALLSGPWLRVGQVSWSGERFTDAEDLERIVGPQRGASVLAVDTDAIVGRLERLPAVASATVDVSVFGTVEATVVEEAPAFVWETRSGRFIGAGDGTILAGGRHDDELPAELGSLPHVIDHRFAARLITIGDVLPSELVRIALRVAAVEPAVLGSAASRLVIRLDDEYGFRLVADDGAWEVALGVYGLDPRETPAEADARLERQVTAVRTLFATRPEAGIGWVDVRNPGKVYFRAKG
jgi:cell division septal protein FtsQ